MVFIFNDLSPLPNVTCVDLHDLWFVCVNRVILHNVILYVHIRTYIYIYIIVILYVRIRMYIRICTIIFT